VPRGLCRQVAFGVPHAQSGPHSHDAQVHAGFAHADPQSQFGPHTHGEQVQAGFSHFVGLVMSAV
jgi:hypothetical protein